MIDNITVDELERRIRLDHPTWAETGVHHEACRIISNFDSSLSTALAAYVREGKCVEVRGDGVSALGVQAFAGCGYIEALEIVNLSLTDKRRAIYAITGRGR